jgi:ABC-2 type transport system ATP-binding protein
VSVVVDQLTKIYGSQKAVDAISFRADKGEILGILGPNGAGKSTTMKVITCFIPPTTGRVLVGGSNVEEEPGRVRKMIGYLPEHNPLYTDMYVREYLHFAGSIYIKKRSTLRQRINEMINICGLDREQHKKIGELSKGYRQRVGLAQALIHDPELLILDEPTTGLDPNQIVEIRQLIRSLGQNKTVIFSSHILQEVQALCDRVVILHRGRIVANDKPANLSSLLRESVMLRVEFKEPVDDAQLRALQGVLEVESADTRNFTIKSSKEIDLRPVLFAFAANNGLTLLRLNQEDDSIEDIFRQLTTNA